MKHVLLILLAVIPFWSAPAQSADSTETPHGPLGLVVQFRTFTFDDIAWRWCFTKDTRLLVVFAGDYTSVNAPNVSGKLHHMTAQLFPTIEQTLYRNGRMSFFLSAGINVQIDRREDEESHYDAILQKSIYFRSISKQLYTDLIAGYGAEYELTRQLSLSGHQDFMVSSSRSSTHEYWSAPRAFGFTAIESRLGLTFYF